MKLNLRKWILGAAIAFLPQLINAQTTEAGKWSSHDIAEGPQNGTLTVEYDVTISKLNANCGLGMSYGAAQTWSHLSPIFSFQTDDHLRAYNADKAGGAGYDADVALQYVANTVYHVVMDVNITTQKYTVKVTPDGQAEVILATDYGFRNQSDVLSTYSITADKYGYTDPDGPGEMVVSNFATTPLTGTPIFEAISPFVMGKDLTKKVDVKVSDPLGRPLTITATSMPAFSTIVDNTDGTAEVTISPLGADLGSHDFALKAVNDAAGEGVTSFNMTVGDLVIQPGTEDATIYSSGEVVPSHTVLFSGALIAWGVNNKQATTATVLPFKIPEVPVGKMIESATLTVFVGTNDISVAMDIDVYALRSRDAATVLVGDYYEGTYDGDASATAIEQAMFQEDKPMNPNPWPASGRPSASTSTSVDGSSNLATFINDEIDNGATTDKYFFVRLSSNLIDEAGYHSVHMTSMDAYNAADQGPKLTIVYKDSPTPVLEDIEPVTALKDAMTNFNLIVTDDEDDFPALTFVVTDDQGVVAPGFADNDGKTTPWTRPGYVFMDASIVVSGTYTVTVTDTDGHTASKDVVVNVVDNGDLISNFSWPTMALGVETTTFQKVYEITPHGSSLDAAIIMAKGKPKANSWGDFSVIIGFNTNGKIKYHDGGYKEVADFVSETTYTFTIDVDVASKTYGFTVVDKATGTKIADVTDAAFRKDDVDQLNTMMFPGVLRSYTYKDVTSLAIDIKEVLSLNIYPNPVVGGAFSIQLPEGGKNFELQIMDLAGKSVYNSSFVRNSNVVNISANLNKGVYIVKLSSEATISTQKLMVK